MDNKVDLDLMEFVEQQILPRYNAFGRSHGIGHVQRVIKNALELVSVTGANPNMVYVSAAYHDLGMEGPRAIHHITSGKNFSCRCTTKEMVLHRTTTHYERSSRRPSC